MWFGEWSEEDLVEWPAGKDAHATSDLVQITLGLDGDY